MAPQLQLRVPKEATPRWDGKDASKTQYNEFGVNDGLDDNESNGGGDEKNEDENNRGQGGADGDGTMMGTRMEMVEIDVSSRQVARTGLKMTLTGVRRCER